ncbi:hypothetical protein PQ472_10580 [Lacticaseibacillus pabuli]|uniref:Uncharacterized protein n=1 Tax=Lacticaseibacillus pabuli TaxID=3025672 RepID=A0ABY7WRB3_9LACO|nr:hypothetical protein [Lacticaseibacillus sp. KACC 23028]WDF82324.1 hypothetical protein PQ472_10580 [Lacticaseibacillus sp. KACC 23028]
MLVVKAKVSGLVLTAVLLAGMAAGVTGATSVSANQDASAPVQTQVEGSSSIEQNIKALPASFFIAPNVTEVNMSNAIPSSRGAWFEFSSKGVLLKYGKQ